MPEEILKNYAGTYIGESQRETEITFEFGRLWDSGQYELKPISKTKFVVIGFRPQVTYEFATNDEGLAESYRVQQKENGIDRTSKRIK